VLNKRTKHTKLLLVTKVRGIPPGAYGCAKACCTGRATRAIVREAAVEIGVEVLAPHDLRPDSTVTIAPGSERDKILAMNDFEEDDSFWDNLPEIVGRHPEIVHGAPVVRDENGKLTRLPADTLVENVQAYMELGGMSESEAVEATLEQFPVHGGAETIRQLLAYQDAHLKQLAP
jgi:hypothetical protein